MKLLMKEEKTLAANNKGLRGDSHSTGYVKRA